MMTFSHHQIAEFLAARSRAPRPALDALTELEARGSAATRTTARIKTPRALADRCAQQAGRSLSTLTAGELATLLRGADVAH